MNQRNRRPRMNQGLFDPRVKKEKEVKYYEPLSTFELLHKAGGNYDMTRQSPMDVMTALATRVSGFFPDHRFDCADVLISALSRLYK